MKCVFRAYGEAFDVDAFLTHSRWRPQPIFHAGERRTPGSGGGRVHRYSGFHLGVPGSDTPGAVFAQQVEAVLTFLVRERAELERLSAFPGLELSVLDFGVPLREELAMLTVSFPLPLVQAAAKAHVALQATIYRTAESSIPSVPKRSNPRSAASRKRAKA